MKELADDNLKVDEIGRRFSKRVKNTVEKGEIARHDVTISPFPSVFERLVQQTCRNQGLFGKGLKPLQTAK